MIGRPGVVASTPQLLTSPSPPWLAPQKTCNSMRIGIKILVDKGQAIIYLWVFLVLAKTNALCSKEWHESVSAKLIPPSQVHGVRLISSRSDTIGQSLIISDHQLAHSISMHIRTGWTWQGSGCGFSVTASKTFCKFEHYIERVESLSENIPLNFNSRLFNSPTGLTTQHTT
jgi:hypothetical protein